MSGRNKNYNSIIFLTTLSVYLGLSLLGATPQVLAYAATTRHFDVLTEIELKDDLDNKPEEESFNDTSVSRRKADSQFLQQYAEYVSDLLNINDPLNLPIASEKAFTGYSLATSKEELLKGFAGLKVDKDSLLGKPLSKKQFDNHNSTAVLYCYNSSHNLWRSESQIASPDKDYLTQNIHSENNQVFVVTRLPRAAIDSLIK